MTSPESRPVLVTGGAGFIGSHTCKRLAATGRSVVALDNLNTYYDASLKEARRAWVGSSGVTWTIGDLADRTLVNRVFADHRPSAVIHLGAQAGIRYSLRDPHAYTESNVTGFLNLLEACRHHPVDHLIFASSSSVYGMSPTFPLRVSDRTDSPISLYAATKKANEVMGHAYSHLFAIPMTGLRFFTVYGPWGRPDMAYWLFTEAILDQRPIRLFNHGKMRRDFTYVSDIVDQLLALLPLAPNGSPPFRLLNIGGSAPVELGDMVASLERLLGRKAQIEYLPMQPGDVQATWADVTELTALTGFSPQTSLEDGLRDFVQWFLHYRRS
ncbi:MAG: NAD-dependent epimerase/dehydratase family protein [Verrucomicrobiia bacterium]